MKTLFKWMSVAFAVYASAPALADVPRGVPTNHNPGTVDRANQERAERERREREERDRRERAERERREREERERRERADRRDGRVHGASAVDGR